jgi:hypothetical protein
MKIDLDSLEKQKELASKHGGAVADLLSLDGSLDRQLLFELDRGLLGAKGEVLTADRYVNFKSDKSFSKLKSLQSINFCDIVEVRFDGLASWNRWTFCGAPGKFELMLVYYGSHNGIGPGDHMWYDVDTFPERSGIFWRVLRAMLPRTGIGTGFDACSKVGSRLEEAVAAFEGSSQLAFDGLTQVTRNDVYAPWTALYEAFSWFLAGAAACSEESSRSWIGLFRKLDGCYARILIRFQAEIERQGGRMLDRESAILSLGDQFMRLSSLWYLRQMLRLHLAEKHISQEEIRPWTLKLLTPRARTYSNQMKIQIPGKEIFEQQIADLQGS